MASCDFITRLTGDNPKRRDALEELITLEADDPDPSKALADAEKHAIRTLHIDVLDADIHRHLGESLRSLKHYDLAIAELESPFEYKQKDADLQNSLAEDFSLADRTADANKLIEDVLKLKPEHDATQTRIEKLK